MIEFNIDLFHVSSMVGRSAMDLDFYTCISGTV